MLWKGRRQSTNVTDNRGSGGGGFGRSPGRFNIPMGGGMRTAGGGGLSGIVILVVLFFVLRACGIDPMVLLDGGQSGFPSGGGAVSQNTPARDEQAQFVSVVLAETEDVWNGIFQAEGAQYEEPQLTLFSGQVSSACGYASAASGPFYCPNDRRIYIDLSFYDQLDQQFGAAGDFAQAYVLAHEVGHHVQNLTGVLPRFNQMRQSMSTAEANAMSIRVELQADCYAGVWARFTDQKGLLESGDAEEALNAATQIGDDTLQKRTQGYVVPESFNHGTSEQRRTWFARGFNSGKVAQCDSINNPV